MWQLWYQYCLRRWHLASYIVKREAEGWAVGFRVMSGLRGGLSGNVRAWPAKVLERSLKTRGTLEVRLVRCRGSGRGRSRVCG